MSRSLARAVGGLSMLAAIGAGFAMLREMALANAFGAGVQVDAYLVAIAIPFLFSTSIISTVEAAFVPIYVACLADGGSRRAERFANGAQFRLLAIGLALSAAVAAAAPLMVPLQAPGFPVDRLALSRQLALLAAPAILFASLYAVGRSVLNAEGRFLAPALAPSVNAAVTIGFIVLGWRTWGIAAAAIGYTAGTAAMWLTVYLPVRIARLPGRGLAVGPAGEDTRQLWRAMRPLMAGVLAMSAIPLVDRFMASTFPAGVISALGYADRVVQLPIAFVATAVTTAAFPAMSRDAARGDLPALRRTLAGGLRMVGLVLVPAAVLTGMLGADLVSLLFERGAFSAADRASTAVLVQGLALGMVFAGAFQLVPRVLNALMLSQLVMVSGVLNLGLKASFNALFVPWLGYIGFALATSAMYAGTGGIMLAMLSRRLDGLHLKSLVPSIVAMAAGAATMALVAAPILAVLDAPLARVMATGAAATAAYGATVWIVETRLNRTLVAGALEPARRAAVHEAV